MLPPFSGSGFVPTETVGLGLVGYLWPARLYERER